MFLRDIKNYLNHRVTLGFWEGGLYIYRSKNAQGTECWRYGSSRGVEYSDGERVSAHCYSHMVNRNDWDIFKGTSASNEIHRLYSGSSRAAKIESRDNYVVLWTKRDSDTILRRRFDTTREAEDGVNLAMQEEGIGSVVCVKGAAIEIEEVSIPTYRLKG